MSIAFNVSVSVRESGRGGAASASRFNLGNPRTDMNGQMTLKMLLEHTKQSLVLIAKQALSEELAKGFDPDHVRVVDGKKGQPIESVSPLGKIEFVARANVYDVLTNIYTGLLQRSPVDTGLYHSSNYVFLNRTLVATDELGLQRWLTSLSTLKIGDEIRFVNVAPYARFLERHGITAQKRGMLGKMRTRKSRDKKGRSGFMNQKGVRVVLAENGAYFLTYRSMKRQFKANVEIKFELMPGSVIPGLAGMVPRTSRSGKKLRVTYARGRSRGRMYLFPCITVKLSGGGLL